MKKSRLDKLRTILPFLILAASAPMTVVCATQIARGRFQFMPIGMLLLACFVFGLVYSIRPQWFNDLSAPNERLLGFGMGAVIGLSFVAFFGLFFAVGLTVVMGLRDWHYFAIGSPIIIAGCSATYRMFRTYAKSRKKHIL
jgi:hypothetical protein